MRTSSELLLTFLLNAVWQIALIGALASFGAWLLRPSATRYQHWLWVAALCLSLVVPAVTAVRGWRETISPTHNNITPARELENPLSVPQNPRFLSETLATTSSSAFTLNSSFAVVLLGVFAAFFLYRSVRLGQAWFSTRKVRKAATHLQGD